MDSVDIAHESSGDSDLRTMGTRGFVANNILQLGSAGVVCFLLVSAFWFITNNQKEDRAMFREEMKANRDELKALRQDADATFIRTEATHSKSMEKMGSTIERAVTSLEKATAALEKAAEKQVP